ncbi:MAG: type IV secretion system protein [Micavibrio aeruginosavorus]|uniref:Type IV secretion system protein n=1 Tax=Micavibrio aeruginosavorus TaxID=349221 RepID=A0A7T5UHR2_9BACT|nr:MAG: type IV secretion system protein [Micavibrio aeruginosavorus]
MSDQKASNTLHENAIGWFLLGLVAVALIWLFWYFNEFEVKNVIRWIRWGQMYVISFFVSDDYGIVWNTVIDGEAKKLFLNYNDALDQIPLIEKGALNNETMAMIGTLAMKPLQFIFIGVIAVIGLWGLLKGPGTEFRRKLNLDGLIGVQSKVFPYITPFVKFNPTQMPVRPPGSPVPSVLPLFSEALGPEEWIAFNSIPIPDGKLDEHAAYIAFARELGPRWQGWQKLAPYKQVLLAAFCLKSARKRKDSDELLGRLSVCWQGTNGLILGVDKTLVADARRTLRSDVARKMLSQCNMHAFETTAMLRALQVARQEGGVLAPAQFVWLRGHDRSLWYPLNNLGRQAFHMEAMAAMCHFKAEKMTQRPIPKPKVGDAVKSIADYMKSSRARPIPQLDYKAGKAHAAKAQGVKKPAGGIKKPAGGVKKPASGIKKPA